MLFEIYFYTSIYWIKSILLFFLENDSQEIEIDSDDEKSCKQDINFYFNGLTISGTVQSGNSPGPENFRLSLYNTKDGTLVSSTTTVAGGKYKFNAKPG